MVDAVTERIPIHRRGALLVVLSVMDMLYGAALVTTVPHSPHDTPRWWPASQGVLLEAPTPVWGWIWIGVGVFLLTGLVPRFGDRFQFAASVALKYLWAFAALSYWLTSHNAGVWGLVAVYAGIATVTLIASGWREGP